MINKKLTTLIFNTFLVFALMVLQASVIASEGVTPDELPEEQRPDSVDGDGICTDEEWENDSEDCYEEYETLVV